MCMGTKMKADFTLDFKKGRSIKILQLADLQTIDLSSARNPIRDRQIKGAYFKEGIPDMETRTYSHVRALVDRVKPDIIVLTGDNIYGEFDDFGRMQLELCELMESFSIPWAPIFGNHDNESEMGVLWQIEQFNASPHCLFRRGNVSGNSNYSILLTRDGVPAYGIICLDSNGCHPVGNPRAPEEGIRETNTDFDKVIGIQNIYPDQTAWASAVLDSIGVPSLGFFHIPIHAYADACREKYGYKSGDTIYPNKDGDYGHISEKFSDSPDADNEFFDAMRSRKMTAMFVGHQHNNSALMTWKGVKLVWGVKTGICTYYVKNKVGGTEITISPDGDLDIRPVYL